MRTEHYNILHSTYLQLICVPKCTLHDPHIIPGKTDGWKASNMKLENSICIFNGMVAILITICLHIHLTQKQFQNVSAINNAY